MTQVKDNIELVLLLNNGDEKAFERIFKHFTPPLFSFASQYVPDDYAEGIVQETMIWLWNNRDTIIPEMSLKSLLFTIVKNKCLNKITREQTKSRILDEIKAQTTSRYENPDFYFEQELMELFRSALDKMPELHREAFEMSRIKKMTHIEIAKELEVSKQTVNYRLSKALDFLKKELKDYLPILLYLIS